MADDSPDPDRIATQQDFGRELTAIRTRAGLTVRQVARAAELEAWDGETGHVLGRFVDERLITVDADVAQITHDALLAAWPRRSRSCPRPGSTPCR